MVYYIGEGASRCDSLVAIVEALLVRVKIHSEDR